MVSATPYRRTFFRLLGFLQPYRVSLAVSILLAVGLSSLLLGWRWLAAHRPAVRPLAVVVTAPSPDSTIPPLPLDTAGAPD